MKKYIEYVGLYTNVKKIYDCEKFTYYKWYDKAFIISKCVSKYYNKLWNIQILGNSLSNEYSTAIIELIAPFANAIDFINDEEKSLHLVENYIKASNMITCGFIDGYTLTDKSVSDEYDIYLQNTTEHYHMKYLKFKNDDAVEKFYCVRFFKLADDLVEMLEIE